MSLVNSDIAQVLYDKNFGPLPFDYNFFPFSGGGDIYMNGNMVNCAVITSCLRNPESPLEDGDFRFCSVVEGKVAGIDEVKIEKQLMANMIVGITHVLHNIFRTNINLGIFSS